MVPPTPASMIANSHCITQWFIVFTGLGQSSDQNCSRVVGVLQGDQTCGQSKEIVIVRGGDRCASVSFTESRLDLEMRSESQMTVI